jgi:hypothetical protein
MVLKSLFFGKYCLIRPLVFSLVPLSYDEYGWGKKVTFQSLYDIFMICKFFSIVRRNCMNLVRYRSQQSFYGTFGVSLCSSTYFINQSKSRFFFCHRDDGLFMSFTNYGISFPITHTGTIINDGRSFINANSNFNFNGSSSVIGSITFLSFLFTA